MGEKGCRKAPVGTYLGDRGRGGRWNLSLEPAGRCPHWDSPLEGRVLARAHSVDLPAQQGRDTGRTPGCYGRRCPWGRVLGLRNTH